MARVKVKGGPSVLREVALALAERQGFVTSGQVADRTGLSRQAVHARLRKMVAVGELFPEGAGRTARYVTRRVRLRLARPRRRLDEARLYQEMEQGLPALREVPPRAERIVHYAFTELVNNAVDHSGGKRVEAEIRLGDATVAVEIVDDGVGAFEKVRAAFGLASEIEAIGEISKGKTTSDPARHTGQGIFFSSKAVDMFVLHSGALRWTVDNRRGDNAIGTAEPRQGTLVRFEVDRGTERELRAVFDEYTTDHAFDRTRTYVRLFAHGTRFVSRSEAKRLLHGLDRFREVVLDFAGVDEVGQGFADEVFRVWALAHAGTRLLPVNMVEPVAFMVGRAAPLPA